jgi:hypothetical protein
MSVRIKISFFILCYCVGVSSLLADNLVVSFEDLQKNIKCSEIQDQTLELDLNGKSYQILIDDLYYTSIINPALVYQRYLHVLKNISMDGKQIRLKQIGDKYGLKIYADEGGFLRCICQDAGFCKASLLDNFRLNKYLQVCHAKLSLKTLVDKAKPKFLNKQPKIISDLNIQVHPIKSFNHILYDYLDNPSLEEVHASTMTIGNQTLDELANKLQHSRAKLKLSYDAAISLAQNPQEKLINMLQSNSRLTLVPLTSGHEFRYFYHIKFIASPQTKESVMASMNFSTPNNNPYIDFNYFFNSPEIRDEFLYISERNHKRFCERQDDFRCLSNFYLDSSSSILNVPNSDKCITAAAGNKYKRSGYFANSEDHDLRQIVIDFLNQAEREIIVISYKLTDSQIAKTLLEKQRKGLNVYSMLAYKSPVLSPEFNNQFYSGTYNKSEYPFPHMKIILIDRKLMLFGTANFTVNALNNTTELIGITDNQKVIKNALDYAAVFSQSNNLDLSRNFSKNSKEINYISVANPSNLKSIESVSLAETLKPEQSWLNNYRLPDQNSQAKLRQCGLDHLYFITSQNYQNCLDSQSILGISR